jgi:hypothetical protein
VSVGIGVGVGSGVALPQATRMMISIKPSKDKVKFRRTGFSKG